MRILVVEDDDRVAAALQDALTQRGYGVLRAQTGAAALSLCESHHVDLVLLDLGLPDIDGTEVAVTLRATTKIPVIVVTARADLPSRVGVLRGGADDYVVKPFSIAELLARIEAVLRRTHRGDEAADGPIEIGDLHVDPSSRVVTVAGARVALTRKEFDVLAILARANGAAIDRQRLLVEVWGTDWLGMSRTLEVHIATLRSKLGRRDTIETVRGVGYRIPVAPPVS